MTQKLSAALVAALLLCGGASLALAQDNTTNPAPAASDTGAPQKDMKSNKGIKRHHAMDACKDDEAKLCAGARGHQKIHECLEKNEDQLSPACKKHHERMEKRWKKRHGDKADKDEKDEKGEKGEPETTPTK